MNTEQNDRWLQAESLLLQAGYNFGLMKLLATYDLNISQLNNDAKGFGALEVAIEIITPLGKEGCVRCPTNERQKKRARRRIH